MTIYHKNIGTEFEKFELYLDEKDYIKMFREEMAFGKLLKIFVGLAKIITEDPQKIKEWASDDRYKEVLAVSKKICENIETKFYGG